MILSLLKRGNMPFGIFWGFMVIYSMDAYREKILDPSARRMYEVGVAPLCYAPLRPERDLFTLRSKLET